MSNPIRRRNPWREGLLAGGLCLVVAFGVLAVVYYQARAAMVLSLRKHLEDLATLAASGVDPALHSSLQKPGQMGSDDYRRACEPLLRLRAAVPEIYYAYTVTRRGNEVPIFTLDTSYYKKNAGDDTAVAQIADPYTEAPDALIAIWKTGHSGSSSEPYSDKWGTFLSGFAPFNDASGQISGVVGVDISMANFQARMRPLNWSLGAAAGLGLLGSLAVGAARFRAQRWQQRSEEELMRATRAAEEAADAARAADRAKSIFLATMSHEIRTPLNGVIGMAEVLSTMPLGTEQADYVNTIRQSGDHLLAVINDILDYSKIEAGAVVITPEPVLLRPCVEETLALFQALAGKKGLALEAEWISGAPAAVTGEPGRVRQILANLLSNALKFTDQGRVTLRIEAADLDGAPAASLTVSDTGPGIAPERQGLLFAPFSQVDDSAARSQGGSGLGLAISRRLANLMGGTLTLESQPGRGSHFRLALPACEPAPVTAPQPASEPVPAEEKPDLLRRNLLVAEDMHGNRRVVEFLLKRLGQTPQFAEDGAATVRAWREHRHEVILMDVSMPGMDGREATRIIRAESCDPRKPWIIALTAGALSEERDAALAAGMNDFITKPVTGAVLAAALARAPGGLARE